MDADRIDRYRNATEVRWNDLREHQVLLRVTRAREAARRRTVSARWVPVAVAACGLIALAAAALVHDARATHVVATRAGAPALTGEVREGGRLALVDGSEVTLGEHARVQVDEEGTRRVRVHQLAGRAHYEVRHQASREFVVQAGEVLVRDLGTVFTVDLGAAWVEVRVEQGRVQVQSRDHASELTAGETLRVPLVVPTVAAPEPIAPTPVPVPSAATTDVAGTPHAAEPHRGDERGAHARAPLPTVDELLAVADAARARGRFADAARALDTLVADHPDDPRVPSARFTLGRVERSQGRPARAAAAFLACWQSEPRGSLAEDALAEAALSWQAAGDRARAQDAARRYVRVYPSGARASRMRALLE